MEEFCYQYDARKGDLTVPILHRLISAAQNRDDNDDGGVWLVSHPFMRDQMRDALFHFTEEQKTDPFVNPLKRIKGWKVGHDFAFAEIRAEGSRGIAIGRNFSDYYKEKV